MPVHSLCIINPSRSDFMSEIYARESGKEFIQFQKHSEVSLELCTLYTSRGWFEKVEQWAEASDTRGTSKA